MELEMEKLEMTNPSTEIQDERDFQRDIDDMYRMADEFFAKAKPTIIVREARRVARSSKIQKKRRRK